MTGPEDVDAQPSEDGYERQAPEPEESFPLEAEPADALEQHREVPQDEDDYR